MSGGDTTAQKQKGPGFTLIAVLIATAVVFALSFVPFGYIVTYPIRLFSTFIHETGHILGALFTFGDVKSMVVNWDTSGLTWTSGGSRFVIGSAGYLGTTFFGVLMLIAARSELWARWAMGITGGVILAVTGLWAGEGSTIPVLLGLVVAAGSIAGMFFIKDKKGVKIGLGALTALALVGVTIWLLLTNGFLTWMLGLVCGLGLLAAGYYSRDAIARFLVAFLGAQVGIDALMDVIHLVNLSTVPTVHTDAHNMARDFGIPAVVWALGWTGISTLLMAGAVVFLIVDYRRQAKKQDGLAPA